MLISELIDILQSAKSNHGDVDVCTWDGNVLDVTITPSLDGLAITDRTETPANEIVLDFVT